VALAERSEHSKDHVQRENFWQRFAGGRRFGWVLTAERRPALSIQILVRARAALILSWPGKNNPVLILEPFKTDATGVAPLLSDAGATSGFLWEGFEVDLIACLPIDLYSFAQTRFASHELLFPALALQRLDV
jgi:hypothetical protein